MLKSKALFEENKLSDTVVEFKTVKIDKLHPFHVLTLSLLLCISVWGVLREWIFLQFLCVLALLTMVLVIKDSVREESLIVIKNFGVQLRTKYMFGLEKTEFLDADRIDKLLIHEFIYGSQVNYSLAFIVNGEQRIALMFKHLNPGFDHLRDVYWTCKSNL